MRTFRPTKNQKRKRAAYRERRRAQLQEWSAKLDLWKARARKTKADVKIRYREQLEQLEESLEAMRTRLRDLDQAREEGWGELRSGLDRAAGDAKDVVDRISRRLER